MYYHCLLKCQTLKLTGCMLTGATAVPAAQVETGRRETDAQEVRTRHHVSVVEATEISL